MGSLRVLSSISVFANGYQNFPVDTIKSFIYKNQNSSIFKRNLSCASNMNWVHASAKTNVVHMIYGRISSTTHIANQKSTIQN